MIRTEARGFDPDIKKTPFVPQYKRSLFYQVDSQISQRPE